MVMDPFRLYLMGAANSRKPAASGAPSWTWGHPAGVTHPGRMKPYRENSLIITSDFRVGWQAVWSIGRRAGVGRKYFRSTVPECQMSSFKLNQHPYRCVLVLLFILQLPPCFILVGKKWNCERNGLWCNKETKTVWCVARPRGTCKSHFVVSSFN